MKWDSGGNVRFGCNLSRSRSNVVPLRGQPTMKIGGRTGERGITRRVDPRTTLPVLTFHALEDRSAVISFPPREFRRGLGRLHARGYRALPLADVVACLRAGRPFPPRTLVLTFDDGYRSIYEEAFPVLRDYAMTA